MSDSDSVSKTNEVLELFPMVDPRFKVSSRVGYGVKKGADNVVCRSYSSNNKSLSQISWNLKTPSTQSYMDRCLMVEVQETFKISASDSKELENLNFGGPYDAAKGVVAFQNFPFNRQIQSISISPNSANLAHESGKLCDLDLRLLSKEEMRYWADCTPCEPNRFIEAGTTKAADGTTDVDIKRIPGSTNSIYSDASQYNDNFKPNGSHVVDSFVYTKAAGTTGGYLTIQVTFREPLLHPYAAFKPYHEAINNLSQLDVTVMLSNKLNQVFAVAQNDVATNFSSIELVSVDKANLSVFYLSPPLFLPLQTKCVVPYLEQKIIQNKQVNGVGLNVDNKISSDTLTMSTMGSKYALFLRRLNTSTKAQNAVQQNYTITGASFSSGRSGIMADFNAYQLYSMSKRNGWQGSWAEWIGKAALGTVACTIVAGTPPTVTSTTAQDITYTQGPVLLVDPIYDLGFPSSVSSGSVGQFDLQCNITFNNSTGQDDSAETLEFLIVNFNPSVLISTLGSSFTYSNLLDQARTLSQDKVPELDMKDMSELVGGGVMSHVGTFAKKLMGSARSAGAMSSGSDSRYR